ncbi:MAG: DNA double-strand break repair nuclease NurA [Drouetiella hepatica Uher 2000/2452]|uniref:DNA double-strand break repair nuclease NurA n=1 Tax=Drouetiella hepatica Uher 2000/2452 TaxID=904376 RepID=A0A951Q7C4_9CYAN|nr:DNA double-strand break repair nuclease NurA [Drouetiella hepatica Uher 2000/2452]
MLDLIKLARQMQGIGQHLTHEAAATRQRLGLAQQLLAQARQHQDDLVTQQQIWRDRLGFAAAAPLEPLDTKIDLTPAPPIHTVLATDGSQIAPSHHEIAYCYLINVGRIALHYGQNRHPLLDNLPEVFYRPEDLYVSRQWGIRTEEWMGYRRTVSEAIVLSELATDFVADSLANSVTDSVTDSVTGSLNSSAANTLAMVDGSLIHWFLEPLPADARNCILPPILEAWDQLRAARIPLVGYISAARSGESLNFLRLHTCPFLAPDCMTHCQGQTEQAPCQVFAPLRDTALWGLVLEPGQRGAIWRSSAKILESYGDHAIHFCYVHMGSEIARVEFPAWVAEDRDLLETALSLTMTQVQKGYGYPVALAEAHNQAVVRGGDRARFFALLEQQMIRAGLRNVGTSYKEARKRGSIA